MSAVGRVSPTITVTSDASGGWGYGAFSNAGKWLQGEWQGKWKDEHIKAKELLPLVMACALWGSEWRNQMVLFRCDNAAVVDIIRAGRSRHTLCMHLMRSFSLFTAIRGITVTAVHLPGKDNVVADVLSPW